MLITRAQGAACRRAAERIAEGKYAFIWELTDAHAAALRKIGWCAGMANADSYFDMENPGGYDQSQVLMALLWCAEIAGE